MNDEFWKNRRVFLTGHTGFKGSWLSVWLQSMGANLIGYSLQPNSQPNLFSLAEVSNGMESVIGDVRDLEKLKKTLVKAQPEVVIHMAAQPLVLQSYLDPVSTYSTNVMGTVNVFEAVRSCSSVKAIVNVTTDKCYENREWIWGYRENEPLGGYDPYSNSKACSELVTAAYRDSYFNAKNYSQHGVGIASARAGNVIGGGDWSADRLIPDILKAFQTGNNLKIRSPNAVRPWQHVIDPLRGYLMLAQKLVESGAKFSGAWNFGPRQEDIQTVKWIVEKIIEKWPTQVKYKIDEENQFNHEANYLKLDISKAVAVLNWKPIIDIEKAIDMICEWELERANGVEIKKIMIKQINNGR